MNVRVLQSCLALAVLSPVLLAPAGCTVMGGSAEKAMALLPESVKQTVSGYLGSLTNLSSLVSGVNTLMEAQAAVPKLITSARQIADAKAALDKLDPATRSNALQAFAPELAQVHDRFAEQLARINSNKSLSAVVGTALEQVELFK